MGDQLFYNIDPEGDLLIILQAANRCDFASWVANHTPPKPSSPIAIPASPNEQQHNAASPVIDDTTSVRHPQLMTPEPMPFLEEPEEIKFRVSSKVLSMCSSYFKLMFAGPWVEAMEIHADGLYHVHFQGFDRWAMRIVLDALHLRHHELPRLPTVDTLAMVCVIVDYLQCHNALCFICDRWFQRVQSEFVQPKTYDRSLVIWTFIASVFPGGFLTYKHLRRLAVLTSRGPFHTLGLPMGEHKVDEIDKYRNNTIGKMISTIYDLVNRLLNTNGLCSFECGSMLLGTLMRTISDNGMTQVRPQEPYYGVSIQGIICAVEEAVAPWKDAVAPAREHAGGVVCYLRGISATWESLDLYSCNVQVLMRDMEMHRTQLEELLR